MTKKRTRQRPNGWAIECLVMVRQALESIGLPMEGCAPMFYDDAVRQVASILGRKAGLKTWPEVVAAIREHEKVRASRAAETP